LRDDPQIFLVSLSASAAGNLPNLAVHFMVFEHQALHVAFR